MSSEFVMKHLTSVPFSIFTLNTRFKKNSFPSDLGAIGETDTPLKRKKKNAFFFSDNESSGILFVFSFFTLAASKLLT